MSGRQVAVKRGGAAAKPAAAAKAAPKSAEPKAARKPNAAQEKINKEITAIAKRLAAKGKMKAEKERYGVSADTGIVVALYKAGYDSKGAALPASRTAAIAGTGQALAKKLIKERETGTPWYELAARTGQPESALRNLVTENGGETKRQYRGR